MIQAYNTRFQSTNEDRSSEKLNARGFVGNLLREESTPPELDSPEFFDFDLAVVGMGFHHFQNVGLATKRLVDRLKPDGVLLILDFVTHVNDAKDHPAIHTVAHHGFSENEVKKLFGDAGLKEVEIVVYGGPPVYMKGISDRTPFLAKGRKPSS